MCSLFLLQEFGAGGTVVIRLNAFFSGDRLASWQCRFLRVRQLLSEAVQGFKKNSNQTFQNFKLQIND
jgi:hypothetical protein